MPSFATEQILRVTPSDSEAAFSRTPRRTTLSRPSVPLPTRDGVGPSHVVLPNGSWSTITDCLVALFPHVSAVEWSRRMDGGEVVDEHGVAVRPERGFVPNLRLYYYRSPSDEPHIPFDEVILFQDEHIVVADKPHFLPVAPSGRFLHETLLVRLKRSLAIDSLVPIHRIDAGTAGVVIFSVQARDRGAYQQLFRERAVEKCYEAVAAVNPSLSFPLMYQSRLEQDAHFMKTREVAGESNASTRIELIQHVPDRPNCAHYRLFPSTGRKHQLRVQCAALGIPIVSDPIYPVFEPPRTASTPDDYARPLQLLARSIEFLDPVTGSFRKFESSRRLEWASAPV